MTFGKRESYNENYIEYKESVDMLLNDLKHMGHQTLTKENLITILTDDFSIGRAVRKELCGMLNSKWNTIWRGEWSIKMKIEDQFLDDNGIWISEFNTEEEYVKQVNRVSRTMKETTTDRDFEILFGYLQLLKRSYTNMIMTKEREENK